FPGGVAGARGGTTLRSGLRDFDRTAGGSWPTGPECGGDVSSADGLGRSNRPNVAVAGDQKPVARWGVGYVSTDVFADALGAPSPAASSSCDLVLTIDDGGIAEVARD